MDTTPDNRPLSAFQIRVFLLIGALVLMDGFDVQAIGFVAPALLRDWKLEPAVLGPVFSAGLLGMLAGSMSLSVLADRIGRRPVLIGSTLFFAVSVLATAAAQSVAQIIVLRLLTGFGIGGVMSNAITLASEYCPPARRASLLMAISCGFTGGAILGGVVAAVLIPYAGWQGVFVVGGVLPLMVAALLLRGLPESVQFLVATGAPRERIERWLARLGLAACTGPSARADFAGTRAIAEAAGGKASVADLFRAGRGKLSTLLWIVSFANLLNLFFLANWLPLLTSRMGYSDSVGVAMGATLQLGGIAGALLLGRLIDRFGFYRTLAPAFLAGAATIAIVGQPNLPLAALFASVLVAGCCVVGGQPGINALATLLYPTRLRATGVGWCLGIGRAGSIAGPMVAAYLIAGHWSTESLFLFAALPAVLSAAMVHAMSRVGSAAKWDP